MPHTSRRSCRPTLCLSATHHSLLQLRHRHAGIASLAVRAVKNCKGWALSENLNLILDITNLGDEVADIGIL
jgi:hypothetical protein